MTEISDQMKSKDSSFGAALKKRRHVGRRADSKEMGIWFIEMIREDRCARFAIYPKRIQSENITIRENVFYIDSIITNPSEGTLTNKRIKSN